MKSFLHLFQTKVVLCPACETETGTKAREEFDQRSIGVRAIETRTETREQQAQTDGLLMSNFRLL